MLFDRIIAGLLSFALAVFPAIVFAQSRPLPGFPPGVFQSRAAIDAAPAGCSDTNATAWVSAVVTAGGTVSAGQQTNVCNLIVALKGHSLFSIHDRIWLYASENAFQAKIDIVNLATHTISGTPTFAASQGYTNSGTDFINTNFIPSSSGVNYTLNTASAGLYIRNNRTTTANATQLGGNDVTGHQTVIQQNTFGGGNNASINDGGTVTFGTATGTSQGFYVVDRTSSTSVTYYNKGTSIATATDGTFGLPAVALYTLANNNNGVVNLESTDQIAVVTIGGALTPTNAANLSTDINAYMTALGTNVY